jgi:AcrR family transcriptional regulator
MQTSERRQQLGDALIRAAERAIGERGLSGLKARDLAQEVGCAVGAIYNVFADLDELVLRANLRTLAKFEAVIEASPAASKRSGGAGRAEAAIADLIRLAEVYLQFASEHRLAWRALFEHRMAGGRPPPDWYMKEQVRLFRYIEEPLRALQPDLGEEGRSLLARSLFSAVHGIVSLGLDEKLLALPIGVLREQVETVVRALGRGLAATPSGRSSGGGDGRAGER